MSNNFDKEASRRHLQRKVKELHTHSYLTLLSIGQAVSFHLLAEEIAHHKYSLFVPLSSSDFPFLAWFLCLETFALLILVWNDFFMVISIYTWVPSLLDATILFSIFASEVFMGKTIMEPQYWIMAMTAFSFCCLMAFVNTLYQSKQRPENKVLLEMRRKRAQVSMRMISALIIILLAVILLGIIYLKIYWAGVFLSVPLLLSYILNTVRTWKQTKAFIDGKG